MRCCFIDITVALQLFINLKDFYINFAVLIVKMIFELFPLHFILSWSLDWFDCSYNYDQVCLCFFSNTSIMQRYWYTVFVSRKWRHGVYSTWGAAGDLYFLILKGWPWFNIHVSLTCCLYLVLFWSYSTLFTWLGFQHLGLLWGRFLRDITP